METDTNDTYAPWTTNLESGQGGDGGRNDLLRPKTHQGHTGFLWASGISEQGRSLASRGQQCPKLAPYSIQPARGPPGGQGSKGRGEVQAPAFQSADQSHGTERAQEETPQQPSRWARARRWLSPEPGPRIPRVNFACPLAQPAHLSLSAA